MKKFFDKLRPEFAFNRYSLINSLKATLACLIGLLISRLFHLEQPQWVLISTLIVMSSQYRLGGALLKGYARLFATALGSSLAAAILFLFSKNLFLVYFCVFTLITLFIYLASNSKEYSYTYTLGAVTMVVIVISTNPQLHGAFNRVIEIMIGVTTAILVSRFIFPIHAEKLLYKNFSETLMMLKTVYQLFIREDKTFSLRSKDKNLEEEIIKNFSNQLVLLKEACTESSSVKRQEHKFIILLRLERRLLRSIYMLHYTLRVSLKTFSNIIKMQDFVNLHEQIVMAMENIARRIQDKKYIISKHNLEDKFKNIVPELRITLSNYDFEDKNKIHAFIFCLGHVVTVLTRMEKIVIDIQ